MEQGSNNDLKTILHLAKIAFDDGGELELTEFLQQFDPLIDYEIDNRWYIVDVGPRKVSSIIKYEETVSPHGREGMYVYFNDYKGSKIFPSWKVTIYRK